jgi:hypothetical protein
VHVDQFRPRDRRLKAGKAGPCTDSPTIANFGSTGKSTPICYYLYS